MRRPDHPDMMRMSELLLAHDDAMDSAPDDDAKDERWQAIVRAHADLDTLTYVAMQRAMRALNVTTSAQLAVQSREVTRLASMFLDGFILGAAFTRAGDDSRVSQMDSGDVNRG